MKFSEQVTAAGAVTLNSKYWKSGVKLVTLDRRIAWTSEPAVIGLGNYGPSTARKYKYGYQYRVNVTANDKVIAECIHHTQVKHKPDEPLLFVVSGEVTAPAQLMTDKGVKIGDLIHHTTTYDAMAEETVTRYLVFPEAGVYYLHIPGIGRTRNIKVEDTELQWSARILNFVRLLALGQIDTQPQRRQPHIYIDGMAHGGGVPPKWTSAMPQSVTLMKSALEYEYQGVLYTYEGLKQKLGYSPEPDFDNAAWGEGNGRRIYFAPFYLGRDANDLSGSWTTHLNTIWHMIEAFELRGLSAAEAMSWPVLFVFDYIRDMLECIALTGYFPGFTNTKDQRYVVEGAPRRFVAAARDGFTDCISAAFLFRAARWLRRQGHDTFAFDVEQAAGKIADTIQWQNPGWFFALSKRGGKTGVPYRFRVKQEWWDTTWLADKAKYEFMLANERALEPMVVTEASNPFASPHPASPHPFIYWRSLLAGKAPEMLTRIMSWADKISTETASGYPLGLIESPRFGSGSAYVWAANLMMIDAITGTNYSHYAQYNLQFAHGCNPCNLCEAVGAGRSWPNQTQNLGAYQLEDGTSQFPRQDGMVRYGLVNTQAYAEMCEGTDFPPTAQLKRVWPNIGPPAGVKSTEQKDEFVYGVPTAKAVFCAIMMSPDLDTEPTVPGANDPYYVG